MPSSKNWGPLHALDVDAEKEALGAGTRGVPVIGHADTPVGTWDWKPDAHRKDYLDF